MGRLPPIIEPVVYPRPETEMPRRGSIAKLEALASAYYGYNWAVLFHIVAVCCLVGLVIAMAESPALLIVLIFSLAAVGVGVGMICHKHNVNAAFGLDWKPSGALIVTIVMGLSAALFYGIFAYAIMQVVVAQQIRLYKVPTTMLGGFRKKNLLARIEALKTMNRLSQTPRELN
jgi:hypothetical protein